MRKRNDTRWGWLRRIARVLGKGITYVITRIAGLIRLLFCNIFPPTKRKVRLEWQAQERRRIRSQAPPDPVSGLLMIFSGQKSSPSRKHTFSSSTSASENFSGDVSDEQPAGKTGNDAPRFFAGSREELIPSEERLLRHLRKRWVRRSMIFCALGGALCLLSLLALSSLSVRSIVIRGNQHYDVQELAKVISVQTGDALMLVDEEAISAQLQEQCTYLSHVGVIRHWNGTVEIVVKERTPVWCLPLAEGKYAILDSSMLVLETVEQIPEDKGIIQLRMEWKENEEESFGIGKKLPGAEMLLARVGEADLAIRNSAQELPASPVMLNLEDALRVQVQLEDGTQILVGSCSGMQEKLCAAGQALVQYNNSTTLEEGTILSVDARNAGRISIRIAENTGG